MTDRRTPFGSYVYMYAQDLRILRDREKVTREIVQQLADKLNMLLYHSTQVDLGGDSFEQGVVPHAQRLYQDLKGLHDQILLIEARMDAVSNAILKEDNLGKYVNSNMIREASLVEDMIRVGSAYPEFQDGFEILIDDLIEK